MRRFRLTKDRDLVAPRHLLLWVSLCLALLVAGSCGDPPSYESTNAARPATGTPPAAAPVADIELVEEGFLGQYNIVRAGQRYYAVPQDGTAFETARADRGDYPRMFIANDLARVKAMTQDGVNTGFTPTSTMLVEEGYKGTFNIIRHNGTYYALSQADGAFDPKKSGGYRGASLQEVKQQIP